MGDVLAIELDFSVVWANFDVLLRAAGRSLYIAAIAMVVSVFLALFVAIARLSGVRPLQWLAYAFTQFFRGIALYVLVVWVLYGLALTGIVSLTAFSAGVAALVLLNAGYLSETFRGSILAVDTGQREAALAVGLSRPQAFRSVVLPQAVRVALPATGNQFVDIIKDSAILAVVAVPELMYETNRLSQQYFRPFEFFTVTMGMYLVAVFVLSFLFGRLERRLRRSERGPAARGPRLLDVLKPGVTR